MTDENRRTLLERTRKDAATMRPLLEPEDDDLTLEIAKIEAAAGEAVAIIEERQRHEQAMRALRAFERSIGMTV